MARTLGDMTRPRLILPVALLAALTLTACSTPIDNIVGGAVDRAVEETLGQGVDITTDGRLPEIPLVEGTIVGGATGADAGWTVVVRPDSADRFAEAEQKLVEAGYTVTASNSDASSAFGSYSGNGYNVQVLVGTDGDGQVTATYIVTNA